MQETKNVVEEALIQMKNVEEAIAENAKGILASTMKEEINQLVKESLSEQDDETEVDMIKDFGSIKHFYLNLFMLSQSGLKHFSICSAKIPSSHLLHGKRYMPYSLNSFFNCLRVV